MISTQLDYDLLRSVCNCAFDAIVCINSAGKIVFWNGAAESIFGYQCDQVLDKEAVAIVVPERFRKSFMRLLAKFKDSGESAMPGKTIETHALRADGSEISVEVAVSAAKIASDWHAIAVIRDVTDRKRRELQIESMNDYTRKVLDANVESISIVTPEGIIRDTNHATAKLFGVPRKYLIGIDACSFFTDPDRAREGLNIILSQGSMKDFLLSYKNKKGELVECSYSGSVLRDKAGNIEGAICTARDITQQVRQQQENLHLAAIVESSLSAIISCTLDGTITSWNQGAVNTYGYSKDEMLGQSATKLLPNNDQEGVVPRVLNRIAQDETLDHLEFECVRKDGQRITISLVLNPIKNATGTIIGASGSSHDISESKKLIRLLKDSEMRFRQICSGALDGIVCMDQDGKATVFNRAAEKMLGYKSEEVIGKNLHALITPERYREAYGKGLAHFKTSGEGPALGKTQELVAKKADGSELPIELSVSAVRINDTWQAIGIMRDISERKMLEQQVKESEQALREERTTLTQTNEKLSLQASELELHAVQMELLTQMEEYLQSCSSDEEAQSMIAQFAGALFPRSSGAVYRFQDSKDWLATAGHWGEHMVDQGPFVHSDCWALRRGQPHSFSKTAPGPRCAHVPEAATSSLCVPLVLLGEVLGLVNINWHENQSLLEDERLVIRMTGVAALALGNLRLRKQLLELSIRDSLTGLFNRRYMEEFFVKELSKARRDKSSLSIFMLDIDHFKQFNDTFGHEAGDAVLRDFGIFLRSRLRESDISCRYGGEEFIVLLPNCSPDIAYQRANDLRNAVKQMQVHCGDQILPAINVSIGLVTFPLVGPNLEDLVRAADAALYQAKDQGRDRVCIAGECTETIKCKDN